ncbi:hypothetical protein, partial [Staphylococcus aureus]|uniref:primosomal protein N' family DNA-binding protein n=1 Tax=Staphylococcus aureus TaxID=1280 RepID=UPI0039BEBC59
NGCAGKVRWARRIFQVQDPPLHRNNLFAIQPSALRMTAPSVDAAISDANVSAAIARVVIDTPLDAVFDYRCAQSVLPGQLVVVPFGNRRVVAFVVDTAVTTDVPQEKLRDVERVLD